MQDGHMGSAVALFGALAALAACVDDQQALQSSEPNYTLVFFASDSVALNKRAQDQLSDAVKNPTPPVRAALQPNSKIRICVSGHSDNVGPEAINKEVVAIIKLPAVREKLATQLMEPVGGMPQEFAAYLKEELDRWGPLIKTNHITLD